ncbi:MAG: Uma2 family endonuclease [Planctomycetes bacterium]|nr:Uma2 family endonuclease [Planctomycetota bacterium]
MTPTVPFTAEMLLRLPDDGYRYELIAGELKQMTPAGWIHGGVVGDLHGLLWSFVRQQKLGRVFGAETGFLLARSPDTVRAPDVAFVRQERLLGVRPKEAFWPGAPDLAAEVVSPGDTASEVEETALAWLAAGTLLVWIVDPKSRTIMVYRSPTDVQTLTESDRLDGQDVVPGFSCQVAEVFGSLQ